MPRVDRLAAAMRQYRFVEPGWDDGRLFEVITGEFADEAAAAMESDIARFESLESPTEMDRASLEWFRSHRRTETRTMFIAVEADSQQVRRDEIVSEVEGCRKQRREALATEREGEKKN